MGEYTGENTNKQKDEIEETEEEEVEVDVDTAEQMQADAENQKNLLQEVAAARKQYNDNYVSSEEEKDTKTDVTIGEIDWYLSGKRSKGFSVKEDELYKKWDALYIKETGKSPSHKFGSHHVPSGEYKTWLEEKKQKINTNKTNVQEKKKKRSEAAKKIINYWNNAGLKEQEERKRWNEAGRANAQKNRDYFNKRIKEIAASKETSFKARKYVKSGKEFVGVYGSVVTMTKEQYLAHCKAEAARWDGHYKNLDWGAKDAEAKIKKLKKEEKKATEKPAQNKVVNNAPIPASNSGNEAPAPTNQETPAPTSTGPAANGTPAYSEGDPYKDKDGNMVTPLKDANGNVVGYKFKDKEGKDQVLMNDDIKKTKVNLNDVKKALEDGDIKKALELLLQALLGKQQSDMQKAQTGNTADGNVGGGAGSTGATPTPEITSKDYIDNRTGVKFTVTKQGDNIQSISQTAQGNIEAFTAEHFAKASIEPKDVEAHLQKGEFTKADELLTKVAAANGKLAARVDVNGNDIVLMDCYGKTFTLNKKKLEEFGMSGKKAEGTLKRLRASIETSKKLQKGDANMALAQVVAGYLPKEKPTVPTPPSNGWTYKKSATRMIDGQEVSITVQKDGQTMKLQPSDFASAYGCSKEEGRQIMKSFARSLRKGNTNLNAELDFVATNMNKEAHDKRRKWARIGYIAGGVALAAGGYFAGRAIFKGHGSSDGDSSDSTETNSTEAKSTEILAATKTTNSNGGTPVTPATPASPYTGTTWLDRNQGRGY